jgi:hypothetical protein
MRHVNGCIFAGGIFGLMFSSQAQAVTCLTITNTGLSQYFKNTCRYDVIASYCFEGERTGGQTSRVLANGGVRSLPGQPRRLKWYECNADSFLSNRCSFPDACK